MTNLGSRDLCNPPLIIRQATRFTPSPPNPGRLSTERSRHSADPLSPVAVRAEVTGAPFFQVRSGISTDRRLLLLLVILLLCFPHLLILLCEVSERFQQRLIFWPLLPFHRRAHIATRKQTKWPTSLSPQPTSARTRTMRTASGSLLRTASTMSQVRYPPFAIFSISLSRTRVRERVQRTKKKVDNGL